jgi:hypothetical protein
MAIFTSESYRNGGLPLRPVEAGRSSFTRKITIPAGQALANGDVLKFARVIGSIPCENVTLKVSDLDTGADIAGTIGFVRATVDGRKAFDGTTNPYLAGAATADAAAALAAAATIQATMRTGGIVKAALAAEADGVADVALTLTASPAGNPNTVRTLELTVDFIGKDVNPGEFSGANTYDYRDNSSGI